MVLTRVSLRGGVQPKVPHGNQGEMGARERVHVRARLQAAHRQGGYDALQGWALEPLPCIIHRIHLLTSPSPPSASLGEAQRNIIFLFFSLGGGDRRVVFLSSLYCIVVRRREVQRKHARLPKRNAEEQNGGSSSSSSEQASERFNFYSQYPNYSFIPYIFISIRSSRSSSSKRRCSDIASFVSFALLYAQHNRLPPDERAPTTTKIEKGEERRANVCVCACEGVSGECPSNFGGRQTLRRRLRAIPSGARQEGEALYSTQKYSLHLMLN